jgi:hypothetical protein
MSSTFTESYLLVRRRAGAATTWLFSVRPARVARADAPPTGSAISLSAAAVVSAKGATAW